MARVSTARSRAAVRDRIAREMELGTMVRDWIESTPGQLAMIGAFVLVVVATGVIGGLFGGA